MPASFWLCLLLQNSTSIKSYNTTIWRTPLLQRDFAEITETGAGASQQNLLGAQAQVGVVFGGLVDVHLEDHLKKVFQMSQKLYSGTQR